MATRATIRTLARIRADQTNSTFPADSEYNTIIDQAAARVWRKLLRSGWKPDRTTVSITANGATSYNVGTDVAIIHSVWRVDGNVHVPIKRVKPEELPTLLSVGSSQGERYDVIGGATAALQIEFYPVPASGTYEIRYTKRFPGFAADGDNWFGPDGSDELVAIDAAIQGVSKEGDDAVAKLLGNEFDTKYVEVCEQAGWLLPDPQTVRDARTMDYIKDPASYRASEGWF